MRPISTTVSSATTSPWIKLDTYKAPFHVGFGCVVTGTATYSIEHTFDNVDGGGTVTAFSHSTVNAVSTNKDGNYAFPVAAVRLNVSATTGSVTLTLIQAGG